MPRAYEAFSHGILEENGVWRKLCALLPNVTVGKWMCFPPYNLSKSNGSQWRSTCVFGVYIQARLIEF